MAAPLDSKFIKSNTTDGSYLKQCRSKGGGGLTLITLGAMFTIIDLFFGILLGIYIGLSSGQILVVFCVAAAFVVILIVPGVLLHKKRIASYLDYFSRKSGYAPEQLTEFDREVLSHDSVMVNLYGSTGKKASSFNGVMTAHWCKFAANSNEIFRLVDIAAIWFDPKPFIDNQLCDPSLLLIDSRGRLTRFFAREAPAEDIIAEMSKRNPKAITVRKFIYGEQEYDAQTMPEQVAALYRSVFEEH